MKNTAGAAVGGRITTWGFILNPGFKAFEKAFNSRIRVDRCIQIV